MTAAHPPANPPAGLSYAELLAAITVAEGQGQEVLDPATLELIGYAPVQDVPALNTAVERAAAAQPGWASLSDEERRGYLHRAADAVEASAEALAELLSREQGKPLNGPNARFEVGGCVAWLRAAADTELPVEVLVDDGQTYAEMHYRPLGVVGAIAPWNWPMMIAIWQIGPALRMGNTVVCKPAASTALCGLALAHVLNQVLPADVLQVVTGPGSTVGDALSKHPQIRKIMFTGSTEVGKNIIAASSSNITRLTLELGGNDAGIVLPDAQPAEIAEGLFWGAFINTGQTCAALKRLYVPDELYDDVVAALVDVAQRMPMGVGLAEENVLGPLQNRNQYETVASLVKAAVDDGATVALGANPDEQAPGYFYPTTIITDIDPHNPLVVEEQFGPALPVIRYRDLDEALAWANESDYGLGASVWTSDRKRGQQIAAQLQAGTVWINSHGTLHPMVPFGGAKQSGYGREFGVEGLKAVSEPQVISG